MATGCCMTLYIVIAFAEICSGHRKATTGGGGKNNMIAIVGADGAVDNLNASGLAQVFTNHSRMYTDLDDTGYLLVQTLSKLSSSTLASTNSFADFGDGALLSMLCASLILGLFLFFIWCHGLFLAWTSRDSDMMEGTFLSIPTPTLLPGQGQGQGQEQEQEEKLPGQGQKEQESF